MSSEIIVELDRNSVCAGDDCESHKSSMRCYSNDTLKTVINAIAQRGYLAQIAGGKATWIVAIGDRKHHRPIAVVAQQWSEPRFIMDPNRTIGAFLSAEDSKGIYFEYHAQIDPEKVLGISN
jgi:hypothetical protein